MFGAESVKSGVYKVILKNTAMASILGVFSGSFTAEQAYKGLSMLEGKENEKIYTHHSGNEYDFKRLCR